MGETSQLVATFRGDRQRVYIEDDRQPWTVGRLLSLAADIARAVPDGAGEEIAVRSPSAAFIVAACLGLWKSGRHALLVDPTAEANFPGGLTSEDDARPGERKVEETFSGQIEPVFPQGDAVEVAFFTSGSTGEPKRVARLARQFAAQNAVEPAALGLGEGLRVLCLVPAHHILGYIYGVYMPGALAGRASFVRGAAPPSWLDHIRRESPQLVLGVPPHFRLLGQLATAPLPAAVYLSSGAPLPADVAAKFASAAGHEITQVYGSTETAGIAHRVGMGAWRPIPGLRWQVREEDSRLLIDAPWLDHPGTWHATDDAAQQAGDDFVLLGRADSIVKIGGRRFSTQEIVGAALACPGVGEAHAITYERYGEPAIGLFAVPRAGEAVDRAALRAWLAERLAPFKVPRTILVIDRLPTRGIGKIDGAALKELAAREHV